MYKLVSRWAFGCAGLLLKWSGGEQFHMAEDRGRAVQIQPTAKNARNHSQCDSMLIGDTAGANTYPYIQVSHRAYPDIFVTFLFGRQFRF